VNRRMRTWLSWARLALLLLVAYAVPLGYARAEPAPIESPPRDMPLVVRPSALHVPPVPATYQEKDLGWLKLAYVPGAYERVEVLIAEAEAVKARLADELGQPVLERLEVRVARNAEEMATLAPSDAPPPAYGSGVAYGPLHLVVLSLTAPVSYEATDLGEVFRHELAHVALEDAVLGHHVPRWFHEGLAIYESGEHRTDRLHTLADATLSRTVIPLANLDRGFPVEGYEVSIAYAESADFVRFLLRDGDRARFSNLIDRARKGEAFDRALADAYGTDLRKLEYQWREDIAKRYSFWPVLTGGTLLWVAVIVLVALAWARKKRKEKATLARWEREEAREIEVAALDAPSVRPEAMRSLPKVEHDGTWHTLH
jgi:peptidase MA superfamily protein